MPAKTAENRWSDQAVAEFGDGPIEVGVDYLTKDFTAIDVPDHLVSCWAPDGEDLGRFQYFKADPQPLNHEMVRRKQTLWLTRKDVYDRRRGLELDSSKRRGVAADQDPSSIVAPVRRAGKASMGDDR